MPFKVLESWQSLHRRFVLNVPNMKPLLKRVDEYRFHILLMLSLSVDDFIAKHTQKMIVIQPLQPKAEKMEE